MKNIFDVASVIALRAVTENLPEGTPVAQPALLPRGADPFFGGARPLLIGGARLVSAPPGGVLIGGAPERVAEVLGFALPPEPGTADDAPEAPAGDAPPEEEAAAPPAAGVASHTAAVAAAAQGPLRALATAVAIELARAAGMPVDCSPAEVCVTGDPRPFVGALPDALVLQIGDPRADVRMIVMLPGVLLARLGVPSSDDQREAPRGVARPATEPEAEADPLGDRLGTVPLDLGLLLGIAKMPLSDVLALADGDVVQLADGVDAPVQLTSGETTVAWGDLEVEDDGRLVLRVSGVPGPRQPGA